MDDLRRAATALLDHPPAEPTPVADLRARNRRRHARRRSRLGVAAVVAALVAATVVQATNDGPGPDSVATTGGAPRGLLALANGPVVDLLDGDGHELGDPPAGVFLRRNVPVTELVWSPDGRTLAAVAGGQLHLLDRDGGNRRDVQLDDGSGAQWLGDDTVALRAGDRWHAVDATTGRATALAERITAGARWSGDGAHVAYVDEAGELWLAGRSGTDATRIVDRDRSFPGAAAGVGVAGVSPDGGWVAVWTWATTSQSLSADGVGLVLVSTGPDRTIVPLGTMLADPTWLAWSPSGDRLALVEGDGRFVTDQKVLRVCELDEHRCEPVAVPPGTSAVDPSWSPAGDRLAFSAVPTADGWPGARLWVVDATTLRGGPVAGAAAGATQPMWTSDGTEIVHVLAGALYGEAPVVGIDRIPAAGGAPTRLGTITAGQPLVQPGRTRVPMAWSAAEGG